ncbi:MAG: YdeI/OmpD-associated family protein [Methanobacteriota archaeon]
MTKRTGTPVQAADRAAWRRWLATNHEKAKQAWLVLPHRTAGERSVSYEEAVEEAICFGWVDTERQSLDETHSVLRFVPRKARSEWSDSNRERAQRLIDAGRMTPAGLAKVPPELGGPESPEKPKRSRRTSA